MQPEAGHAQCQQPLGEMGARHSRGGQGGAGSPSPSEVPGTSLGPGVPIRRCPSAHGGSSQPWHTGAHRLHTHPRFPHTRPLPPSHRCLPWHTLPQPPPPPPPPAACTQAGPSHLPTHTRACATHTRSSAHACTKTRAHPRARALAGVAPTHRLNAVGTHTETGPRSAPHP